MRLGCYIVYVDMDTEQTNLASVGDIGRKLNVPAHRVDYVIKSRGVRPVARIGGWRVFDRDGAERITRGVAEIERRREHRAVR